MASVDLSLDDIIKKKKIGLKPTKGFKKFGGNNTGNNRGNAQSNPARRAVGVQQGKLGAQIAGRTGPQNARRGGIQTSGRPNTLNKQTVVDARNRIIQKRRLQLTDARDKLCEIAKKTDARQKLQKLREMRMGHDGVIGYNGLSPGQRKPLRSALKGIGRPVPPMAGVTLQRTINQSIHGSRYIPKVPALMDMDFEMSEGYRAEGPLALRRTVSNDQMRMEPLIRPSKLSNSSPYSWKAPQRIAPPPPQSSRGYIDLDYPAEERKRMKLPSPPPMMRPIIVSDDEDMPEPVRSMGRPMRILSGNTVSASKSRLDSSRVQQSSSSAVTSGYRIVVSNLQSTVTHEDIRELFEDVGPLVTSRLVRPGTAEVAYRNFKDAERAVENYHNRQLDGQPMKCLLVKPRMSTSSSAVPSSGSLRGPMAASSKLSGSGKSSIVPDINTIHKALFNKS